MTTAVQQDKTVKLCLVGMSNEGSVGTEPSFECTNEKPFLYPTNSMVGYWTEYLHIFAERNLIGRWLHPCLKSLTFFNFLTQATEPTEWTDPQCIENAPHAKSMRSVDGSTTGCGGFSLQRCGTDNNKQPPQGIFRQWRKLSLWKKMSPSSLNPLKA